MHHILSHGCLQIQTWERTFQGLYQQIANALLTTLSSHIHTCVQVQTSFLQILLLVNVLGRQGKMAQVFGHLSPMWETCMEFWTPSFSMIQVQLQWPFGDGNLRTEFTPPSSLALSLLPVCPYLCVLLIFKQINLFF